MLEENRYYARVLFGTWKSSIAWSKCLPNAVVGFRYPGATGLRFWVCYPGATSLRAARQSSLDGCLHEFGREERERDRHIDLSNAAFIPRRRWLDEMIAGTVTSVEQPRAIAATSVARVSARIGRRSCGGQGSRHEKYRVAASSTTWKTALSSVVDRSIRIIELQDIEKRIEVLERAGINRDEQKDF
jgi:hypothetical protein